MGAGLAILDYGMGNLRSVEKAFEHVGAEVIRTPDPDRAAEAEGLVLPGVGAFPQAMRRVRELGFDRLIAASVERSKPVLGICLGMQLLFERSSELGGAQGLGLLGGEVAPLAADGLKVPHIGWEPVRWDGEAAVVEGIDSGTPFYFVHSYAPRPADPADVLGTAVYGERFVCAVARPPLYGFQFHPEKSSHAGLELLRRFAAECGLDVASGPARQLAPT